jgi:hypothetical protein
MNNMDIFPNKHLKRHINHGEQNRIRQAQRNIILNHFNNTHLRQLNTPVASVASVSIPDPVVSVSVSVSVPDQVVSAVSSVVENTHNLQYIKDKMITEYKNLYK